MDLGAKVLLWLAAFGVLVVAGTMLAERIRRR